MLIQGGQTYELFPIFLFLSLLWFCSYLNSPKAAPVCFWPFIIFRGTGTCSVFSRYLACLFCVLYTHTHKYVHKTYIYFFVFPIQLSHPLIPSFLADFTIYTFFPILPFVQAFDSPMVDLLLHIISTFLLRFAEICVCCSFN